MRPIPLPLLALTTVWFAAASAHAAPASGVQIKELPDRLRVEINGQLFTEYFFKDAPRPYCHPLLGPHGIQMSRDWPMKESPGEDRDHPHHRSFWFAHGDLDGQDFWSEGKAAGKTVHEKFTKISSSEKEGVIQSRNQWIAKDGAVICTDDRRLRIYNRPDNERLFDFEITLHAGAKDFTLGDTKEGSMAIRLAESMRLKPNKESEGKGKPTGHIVNSEGARDDATWGKRAAWCDYSGPVAGQTLGVAIFDHPSNPRHPTWWHVRDYGLFAANPFGQHDFEKLADKTAGKLVVPAGKSVTFRYRFYMHDGDEKAGKVAERYAEFSKTK
ncbi:MAG: hypothetical protein EXS35_11440 [Pedosphaera sp.]|nr:hypothetical protein [Pedosphaera sp.]